jgi:hypothetical protein
MLLCSVLRNNLWLQWELNSRLWSLTDWATQDHMENVYTVNVILWVHLRSSLSLCVLTDCHSQTRPFPRIQVQHKQDTNRLLNMNVFEIYLLLVLQQGLPVCIWAWKRQIWCIVHFKFFFTDLYYFTMKKRSCTIFQKHFSQCFINTIPYNHHALSSINRLKRIILQLLTTLIQFVSWI